MLVLVPPKRMGHSPLSPRVCSNPRLATTQPLLLLLLLPLPAAVLCQELNAKDPSKPAARMWAGELEASDDEDERPSRADQSFR